MRDDVNFCTILPMETAPMDNPVLFIPTPMPSDLDNGLGGINTAPDITLSPDTPVANPEDNKYVKDVIDDQDNDKNQNDDDFQDFNSDPDHGRD